MLEIDNRSGRKPLIIRVAVLTQPIVQAGEGSLVDLGVVDTERLSRCDVPRELNSLGGLQPRCLQWN